MKFIDLNNPGNIWEGDQTHYNGLEWLGGCPVWISDALFFTLMQIPVCESDPTLWRYQTAPPFWANNEGRPDLCP